mmetsp:Transcript_23708/g.52025  ORF Transcript_23708/g.52025 Transcript_23708/m.52025 type:complete len:247 (+) Transcript_23708:1973-2713(+)
MAASRSSRTARGTCTCMASLRHSPSTSAALTCAPWWALAMSFWSIDHMELTALSSLAPPLAGFWLTSLPTRSFSRLLICLFSGMSSTCSKQPKGRVTEAGSLISAGSLPCREAKFLLLAPTTPLRYSDICTAHLPHHLGTSILRPLAGMFLAASCAAAAASEALASVQVTDPEAVVVKCRVLPLAARIWSRGPLSWHVANSTCMLRARTLTWDRTSGASGVSTATTPSGISSSPVTCSASSTVGTL